MASQRQPLTREDIAAILTTAREEPTVELAALAERLQPLVRQYVCDECGEPAVRRYFFTIAGDKTVYCCPLHAAVVDRRAWASREDLRPPQRRAFIVEWRDALSLGFLAGMVFVVLLWWVVHLL